MSIAIYSVVLACSYNVDSYSVVLACSYNVDSYSVVPANHSIKLWKAYSNQTWQTPSSTSLYVHVGSYIGSVLTHVTPMDVQLAMMHGHDT